MACPHVVVVVLLRREYEGGAKTGYVRRSDCSLNINCRKFGSL
jgi:hypothetical protein